MSKLRIREDTNKLKKQFLYNRKVKISRQRVKKRKREKSKEGWRK